MTGAGVDRSAPRMPGMARMAPMLTTGLDGASKHDVGVGDGVGDAGRRRWPCRPRRTRSCGSVPVPGSAPTTPGNGSPDVRRVVARIGDRRRGFRCGRRWPAAVARPGAQRSAQRLGHLRTAGSRLAASGCAPDGWPGRGRRGRTSPAARRRRRVPPWRARFRCDGPSRAPGRCRRPGCTCRCRGRGRCARRASRRRRRR